MRQIGFDWQNHSVLVLQARRKRLIRLYRLWFLVCLFFVVFCVLAVEVFEFCLYDCYKPVQMVYGGLYVMTNNIRGGLVFCMLCCSLLLKSGVYSLSWLVDIFALLSAAAMLWVAILRQYSAISLASCLSVLVLVCSASLNPFILLGLTMLTM